MSLNIKTATGLLEIGGNVTKEKVISALGYEPADKTHTEDKTVHVTTAEKETWNNKSDFSGAYADLIDAPNITENGSGNMVIADENGNIIMRVDEDGLATTNVSAKTINLDGEDLGVRLDEMESSMISGIENESGKIEFTDESSNVIARISADGFETTTVTAKNVVVDGKDVGVKFDEQGEEIGKLNTSLSSHTSNSTVHITADERTLWNNKSDFSGDYNDLRNAPDIKEDSSGEVVYADESGNVIVKIGENGLETTQVIANNVILSGQDVGSHIGNNNLHITSEERTSWNAKADTTYVDTKVAALVDSSPEALNTLNELAAALGDDPNFATTVANQIGLKANQTALDSHTSNKNNPHGVTASQIGLGNVDNTSDANKPVSTAQQAALDNLKAELSESIVTESDEWIIVDESGNIIARVDENGLETTTVTAKNVVVNGVDVKVALDGKANSTHTHAISDVTNLQNALDNKSNIGHTHDEYLMADDIANKADKSELHSHNNKIVLDSITSDKVASWDDKSDFSGDYNDLENAPNIYEDGSDNLVIADQNGNIIFRSDSNGFETTILTAQSVVVDGTNVKDALDGKMDKSNPVGTGSFSLNRKSGSTVGAMSVAIGYNLTASGNYSYAEGIFTTSSGDTSHAQGYYSEASGNYAHAAGMNTKASGEAAYSEGKWTIAAGEHQHVQGRYNVEDNANTYAHIVGNGSSSTKRSNAHTLDWSGNAWFAGEVWVGGAAQGDGTAKKLATTDDVSVFVGDDTVESIVPINADTLGGKTEGQLSVANADTLGGYTAEQIAYMGTGTLPIGSVVLWSGDEIPAGWELVEEVTLD